MLLILILYKLVDNHNFSFSTENKNGVVYKGSFTIGSLLNGMRIYIDEAAGNFKSVDQGRKFIESISGAAIIGLFDKSTEGRHKKL